MAARSYHLSKRAKSAQATRKMILEAALELFMESGYHGVTVVQVAARAGVSLNAIYGSIGGKPQLLIALNDEAAQDPTIEIVMDAVVLARSGREVIAAFARGTRNLLERHEWLLGQLYDSASADPRIHESLTLARGRFARRLSEAVARLGELRSLSSGVTLHRAEDVMWFHFGFPPWQQLRTAGWDWSEAEVWLLDQATHALLRASSR